jgi:hypothetical protein
VLGVSFVSECVRACVQRSCVAVTCRGKPEFCIHDMFYAITGQLAHDGTGAGKRSLEAIPLFHKTFNTLR